MRKFRIIAFFRRDRKGRESVSSLSSQHTHICTHTVCVSHTHTYFNHVTSMHTVTPTFFDTEQGANSESSRFSDVTVMKSVCVCSCELPSAWTHKIYTGLFTQKDGTLVTKESTHQDTVTGHTHIFRHGRQAYTLNTHTHAHTHKHTSIMLHLSTRDPGKSFSP